MKLIYKILIGITTTGALTAGGIITANVINKNKDVEVVSNNVVNEVQSNEIENNSINENIDENKIEENENHNKSTTNSTNSKMVTNQTTSKSETIVEANESKKEPEKQEKIVKVNVDLSSYTSPWFDWDKDKTLKLQLFLGSYGCVYETALVKDNLTVSTNIKGKGMCELTVYANSVLQYTKTIDFDKDTVVNIKL